MCFQNSQKRDRIEHGKNQEKYKKESKNSIKYNINNRDACRYSCTNDFGSHKPLKRC